MAGTTAGAGTASGESGSGQRAQRTLLLGLDAAESELLFEMIDDGRLPHLARMRATGAWGTVTSPSGFGSGAVWPSFATGVSPARHGRYYYTQVRPGSYEGHRFEAEEFKFDPIWVPISEAGRRVAVFDVPKVGLSEGINGVQAVDWLVHGAVYQGETETWPTSYRAELHAKYGADPLPKCDFPGVRDSAQTQEFLDIQAQRILQRERCTLDLVTEGGTDLLVTVYPEPHCVGHQTWHVRDAGHPMHDAIVHAAVGDPLATVYELIDASIGRILAAVDDHTAVVVFSGTGMGPNYTGNRLLDDVLRRLEGSKPTMRTSVTRSAKTVAKRYLPRSLRQKGRPIKRRVEEHVAAGDRARRKAYAVPHNDIAGAIRLNIAGREADGQLRPDEVDAFVEQLAGQLLALRNADTGAPVVERVTRTRDEMTGDWIDHLPDLFVIWNREGPIDRVTSPAVGTVEYRHRGNRTGDHTPDSCFFAIGPGIRPGKVEDSTLYDFAPTLAAMVGVDVTNTDGTVIDAMVAGQPVGG